METIVIYKIATLEVVGTLDIELGSSVSLLGDEDYHPLNLFILTEDGRNALNEFKNK